MRVLLRHNSIDVTAVAETWLSENDDHALLVSGSTSRVFCCERACAKSRAGGRSFAR